MVSETDGGQQITCQLSAAVGVPKGTYKVRLASHGLDPTDPLTVATLTVTLVEAVPEPEPKKVVSITGLSVDRDTFSVSVSGVNFEGVTGYALDPETQGESVRATFKVGEAEAEVEIGHTRDPEDPTRPWVQDLPEELRGGGKLTVILTPDPEKADEYDQTPAVKTEA